MAWKDSTWKIAWDGRMENPVGHISDDQLPCTAFVYKYVVHKEIYLGGWLVEGSPVNDYKGVLTHHIGTYFKETIYPTWRSTIFSFGFGLVFWTLQYMDNKELRVFYKWLLLEDLPEVYQDKIQDRQTLVFNLEIGENCEIKDAYTLYSGSFNASPSNQNVYPDLLVGEKIYCMYQGKEICFTVSSNDGKGNVICRGYKTDDNEEIVLTDLSVGTELTLEVSHAWVEIGIYGERRKDDGTVEGVPGEYTWWGDERYSFNGVPYFNMTSSIYGMYTAGDYVMLDGELGSPIINASLPENSTVCIVEHSIGIPFIGPRWAVYWFKTLAETPGISITRKKDCHTFIIAYTEEGKLFAREVGFSALENTYVYKDIQISSNDDTTQYTQPLVFQDYTLNIHFICQGEGNKIFGFCTNTQLDLVHKYEICTGKKPAIVFDDILSVVYLMVERSAYVDSNGVQCLAGLYMLKGTRSEDNEYEFEEYGRLQDKGNIDLGYSFYTLEYNHNTNQLAVVFTYSDRIVQYTLDKNFKPMETETIELADVKSYSVQYNIYKEYVSYRDRTLYYKREDQREVKIKENIDLPFGFCIAPTINASYVCFYDKPTENDEKDICMYEYRGFWKKLDIKKQEETV